VNHEQNADRAWFIPDGADCVPAPLSRFRINTIRANKTKLILKDESGQLERDSAMVPLISAIFGLVPFIPHVYIQTVSQLCSRAANSVSARQLLTQELSIVAEMLAEFHAGLQTDAPNYFKNRTEIGEKLEERGGSR